MKDEITIQTAAPRAPANAAKPFVALATTTFLAIVGLACFGAGRETPDPAMSDPQLRAARIEELKQAIDQDHARLEDLITQPRGEDSVPLHDNAEMREIAARLTELERELDRFEAAARTAQ